MQGYSSTNKGSPTTGSTGPNRAAALGATLVLAVLVVLLGVAQVTLDVAAKSADPLLQDAFRLALGALLASIAADRALESRASTGGR